MPVPTVGPALAALAGGMARMWTTEGVRCWTTSAVGELGVGGGGGGLGGWRSRRRWLGTGLVGWPRLVGWRIGGWRGLVFCWGFWGAFWAVRVCLGWSLILHQILVVWGVGGWDGAFLRRFLDSRFRGNDGGRGWWVGGVGGWMGFALGSVGTFLGAVDGFPLSRE